jgi:MraZ protein
MAKFRGRYDFSVDQKGRINIPSKFRKLLLPEAEETFVIFRAPADCLCAYPLDEWDRFAERLERLPNNPESDMFQRMIHQSLADSTLDGQGRISLTPFQMQIAGIEKDATIIGRGGFLEIWDPKRFEAYAGGSYNFSEMYYRTLGSGSGSTE